MAYRVFRCFRCQLLHFEEDIYRSPNEGGCLKCGSRKFAGSGDIHWREKVYMTVRFWLHRKLYKELPQEVPDGG